MFFILFTVQYVSSYIYSTEMLTHMQDMLRKTLDPEYYANLSHAAPHFGRVHYGMIISALQFLRKYFYYWSNFLQITALITFDNMSCAAEIQLLSLQDGNQLQGVHIPIVTKYILAVTLAKFESGQISGKLISHKIQDPSFLN